MYVERVAGVTSFVFVFVWLRVFSVSLPLCLLVELCFCVGLLFGVVLDVILRLMIH